MKRGFTLIEVIVTLLIMGILSAGILVSIKNLYLRAAKSDILNRFSMTSQIALDSLSSLLYNRISSSLIGYNPLTNSFKSVYLIDGNLTILEWLGTSFESFNKRDYTGFIDLDISDKNSLTLVSYDINISSIDDMLKRKFGQNTSILNKDIALVFAGSFDSGGLIDSNEFNNTFGWHGNNSNKIYSINSLNVNSIVLDTKPDEIYEKYYFVDSAYAVARGADIDQNTSCIKDLNISAEKIDNSLLLFYNYRPWKSETFCADPNGLNQDGNVTLILEDVVGFEVGTMNDTMFIQISLEKVVKGSKNSITVSKQKVVF